MSRDSNGNATVNRQQAVTGQTVLAEQVNVPFADVEAMLNLVFWRDGLAPATGNFNLNSFKITGVGDAQNPTDAVNYGQLTAIQSSVNEAFPPGMVAMFRLKTAPAGWVSEGASIGNIGSGANYANSRALNLFTKLWNEFSNTELPIQNSSGAPDTRGASALADWNANKRMPTFDSRNRFPRAADNNLNVDPSIVVGLSQDDAIKSHSVTITDPGHRHYWGNNAQLLLVGGGPAGAFAATNPNPQGAFQTELSTTGITAAYTGATETRPRSSVYLFCIKL